MIDQHSSLAEKFLKKGFWLYLFSFIIAPIGYVIKILISGEVSVSEIWILYGIISLITLLSAFSDLWVWESIKYFIPKYIQKKEYRKIKSILVYSLICQLISGSLLMIMFFFWAEFLALHYFKTINAQPIIQVFALFFLWISIFQIITQFFLAVQNTLYFKLAEFIRNTFMLIATIAIVSMNINDVSIFAYSWIIGLYIGVIFAIILFIKNYYRNFLIWQKIIWSKKLAKKFFSYALVVFISVQASIILSQIDMQMVIYLLSTTDAGYYSIYLSLIMIPFIVIGPIFIVLMPIFSELSAKKDENKIKSIKVFLTKYFILIWVLFSLLLFIFADTISYVLFWPSFAISWDILKYSCLFLVFNILFQINFNLLGGIWKVKYRFYITLIAIIINTILNVILLNYIWVAWAALATGIGWLCIWIMSEIVLWKKYFHIPNIPFLLKNTIGMWLISLLSYHVVTPYLPGFSRWESLFLILWISAIWLLCVSIINFHECKQFIWEIKKLRIWKK